MVAWSSSAFAAARASGEGEQATGRRNLLLLVNLRWLAVAGQAIAILVVEFGLRVHLPLLGMSAVLAALVTLNLLTLATMRRHVIGNRDIFLSLLFDVSALSAQLLLSGGASNPFISLYLLQIVLAALLLDTWSSWTLVAVAAVLFGLIAAAAPPLPLPAWLGARLSAGHIVAIWSNFLLSAVLLVAFLTRINRNLRARDAYLAEMRQQAAEEDHIVRMGLLASGAAHELGTPLSSIAVILADWKSEPAIARTRQMAEELAEMQSEIARCKQIVRGILLASGEVLGDAPAHTSLRVFLRDVATGWDALHPGLLHFEDRLGADLPIIGDRALAQIIANMLDNALEAGATRIHMRAEQEFEEVVVAIEDDGSGFSREMLQHLGKPYQSSKGKRGGGLGLFLAVNVVRKLGGKVTAQNRQGKGARVMLRIPLASLGGATAP